VHDFVLSKSQKEVLRRLNDFLINDRRGKAIVEESSSKATTKCAEKKMAKEKPAKSSEVIEKKDRSRKKKVVRRERALQRLREKGIDIEKVRGGGLHYCIGI
jgi:pyruvate/2-oxoglutarate dehydrogenase complex dihydrolipoamide acyltransferase (E2) component